MTIYKIAGWLFVALCVVAAFVTDIPYTGLALAVLGAIVAWNIAADHYVRVIVSAIALPMLAKTFDAIPMAGPYITSILTNLGMVVAGAAIMVILKKTYARVMS
jgi:hypothetical protein